MAVEGARAAHLLLAEEKDLKWLQENRVPKLLFLFQYQVEEVDLHAGHLAKGP